MGASATLVGGGVSERPKEHASKACVGNTTVGSNPTATATVVPPRVHVNAGRRGLRGKTSPVTSPQRSAPVDGFSLSHRVHGDADAPAVVLLHGWPGSSADYRAAVPLLADRYRVVVPDLRGFGESDRHERDPDDGYRPAAQARSVAGLVEELGLTQVVVGGYDVGSGVARALAGARPDLLRALAICPPVPGAGERILAAEQVGEWWYQFLHRLPLGPALLDGNRDAVASYLRHFWTHWSGPSYVLDEAEFARLVDAYARPGAFTSSIQWYRAKNASTTSAALASPPAPADRIQVPTRVLWPEHDPLFPRAWADNVGQWFADVEVDTVDGAGHFVPLEAPEAFAAHVDRAFAAGR